MRVVYKTSYYGFAIFFSNSLNKSNHDHLNILTITKSFIRLNLADLYAVNAYRLHITCVLLILANHFILFFYLNSEDLHTSTDPNSHLTLHTIARDVHGLPVGTNTLHIYTQGHCAWGPPSRSLQHWNGTRKPLFSLPDQGW